MAYRNGNYSAFYVNEPFSESNLGAHATEDFSVLQSAQGMGSRRLVISFH